MNTFGDDNLNMKPGSESGNGAGSGGGESFDAAAEIARERLITRLTDNVASSRDWSELAVAARTDATIFADLADTRRMAETLSAGVEARVAAAEAIELEDGDEPVLRLTGGAGGDGLGGAGRPALPARWKMGWAVAAALALVTGWQFVAANGRVSATGREPIQAAGILNVSTPEKALDAYYELGKKAGVVVTELPQRYVLESRTLPDGRQEVLYLRQVLERSIVNDVFRVGTDEQGRPVLVPASAPAPAGPAL
jgi:hypothetical protein